MTADKISTATPNNEVGAIITRSRRVVLDVSFGEMATWIKSGSAGDVVWYNSKNDEYGVWNVEAGEGWPIACDMIVTSHTIDGTLESTTATNLVWASTAPRIGN